MTLACAQRLAQGAFNNDRLPPPNGCAAPKRGDASERILVGEFHRNDFGRGRGADRFRLPPDQREALIKLDLPTMVQMGAHPLVPFLAEMAVQRLRASH